MLPVQVVAIAKVRNSQQGGFQQNVKEVMRDNKIVCYLSKPDLSFSFR